MGVKRVFQDITGMKFGRLTVKKYEGVRGVKTYWACECECGQIVSIRANSLKTGNTLSCGCYKKERDGRNIGHKRNNLKDYYVWTSMKQRCNNSKCKAYKYYGGRGIRVCERWDKSFADFLSDMGKRPIGMSIERINNDGNYEPNNCRWATQVEQANNTRKNILFSYKGKMVSLSELAAISGISRHKIYSRIHISKWSVEKAIEK